MSGPFVAVTLPPCLRSRRRSESSRLCLPSAWRGRDERAAAPTALPSGASAPSKPPEPLEARTSSGKSWGRPRGQRGGRKEGRKETWPGAIGGRRARSGACGCGGIEQAAGDSASRVPSRGRLSLQVLRQQKTLRQLSLCPQCTAICFLRRRRGLHPRFPKRGKGRSSPELGGL